MPPEILLPVTDPKLVTELDALARRHRGASGPVMQVLGFLGGSAEGLVNRLPAGVRSGLEGATERALDTAMAAARRSRGVVADRPDWVNTALATAMGAAGGFGGLPGALAELPFTVTMLLRAIQGIAAEHGFDPASDEVRLECLRVFASAGPLARDDGTDMGFFTAKVTITGTGVSGLIARVAPRLSVVLGEKLAAQTAPVLGAVAGAAVNYAFTSYYQEIARVHFGLKRLARDSGEDEGLLREELVARITARR
ncbi:EcsC family protein [Sinirhodobacter huangdaonensis]|uniref:Protein EcsC n=1 Tax=Paenirhodobacter huangdaonensis TaxID=2501515 RepID=A0A3S3M968_9RHOB|nr:EcsC family protein [Sinirhodobacter huangdaonensis]RWR51676.1 protein EcsC [Sinirhodobacter huangdaonensis]